MFEDIEGYAQQLVEFVRVHQGWAVPVVFALAFGESLAFISLLIPAWAALVGIGVLIGSGHLEFWPIWVAGSIGAALGDWLSYWVGIKLGPPVAHVWPLSRHPDLLPKGEAFVTRWGVLAIFIGRFFGPLRASVPLGRESQPPDRATCPGRGAALSARSRASSTRYGDALQTRDRTIRSLWWSRISSAPRERAATIHPAQWARCTASGTRNHSRSLRHSAPTMLQ